jgi:hypothetical protein
MSPQAPRKTDRACESDPEDYLTWRSSLCSMRDRRRMFAGSERNRQMKLKFCIRLCRTRYQNGCRNRGSCDNQFSGAFLSPGLLWLGDKAKRFCQKELLARQ